MEEDRWYEVYEGNTLETKTVAICNTLKEAQEYKRKNNISGNLYIGLWEDKINPKNIAIVG